MGTNIGGVVGLLIAVPVAGFIKDAAEGFSKAGDFENTVEAKPPSELLAEESISQ
jgi:predicted PurR-regulated permease PerM